MNRKDAAIILGCSENDAPDTIKSKYKKMLHEVHPDANLGNNYHKYTVQDIIEAYKTLCSEHVFVQDSFQSTNSNSEPNIRHWDAPENKMAYTYRSIFQNVEDSDGNVIGCIEVASGKYMWQLEEDFPLFLKSIYECGKRLLEHIDDTMRLKVQPQLSFLLAQQFMDTFEYLNVFATKEENDIYFVNAMVELKKDINTSSIRSGMSLYPKRLHEHKLFLQNKAGEEVGYLSFKDDRLYYCIIPLFEQKRAQVKVKVSATQDRLNTKNVHKYKNIDLWIKLININTNEIMEDLNIQIDNIIKCEE